MINLSALVYRLDRQSATPLFVQLSNEIRTKMVNGEIESDQQLPPSRVLATELGLSRSTVTSAYEQLIAEGYVEGRQGAGYYSCSVGPIDATPDLCEIKPSPALSLTETSHPLNQPSFPDMRLFPYRQWAQCVSRVARLTPEALIDRTGPFGDLALRHSIVRHLREWRGIEASPEQIVITAGSIDALEICIRTLASAGDYVGLENPGYRPLRNIIGNLGMKPFWLPMGERDVEIPPITGSQAPPSLSILTPSHHFPLGGAMSPLRRREFLHWAEQSNSWIIEDDYDSEFRYAGSPIQALAGFDTSNRTIYVGTFSKIFSVGLRLGFLVAPPSLIPRINQTLSRFGVKAAVSAQRALSVFMESGAFYRHLRRTRRIYGERQKVMLQCLETHLSDIVTYQDHAAGMQLVLGLPASYDDQTISARLKVQGVVANPLSTYYALGEKRSGLILGFCGSNEAEIKSNILIIEQVLRG